MNELIRLFDLSRCSKSGAKFDYKKAIWFNHQYIQQKADEELAELFLPVLERRGVNAPLNKVIAVVGLMKERVNFVKDLWDESGFFFIAPVQYDEKTVKKRWKENSTERMTELAGILQSLGEDLTSEEQEHAVMNWITEKGYHTGDIMNAFRLALVGESKGPHLFDITSILGKEETLERVKHAIAVLN
jgi:glutamyl-tRNA synthetase